MELKDYSILDIEAMDDERFEKEKAPGKWVPESRVYLKDEADEYIGKLKDAQRWRKYNEEKPVCKEAKYLIASDSGFIDCDRWKKLPDGHWGFSFYDYGVKLWRPLPEALADNEIKEA